jgi:transposase
MINLQKKQEIILLHVRENYSRRKIAKQLGLDRATVGKYIDEYEEKKEKNFYRKIWR